MTASASPLVADLARVRARLEVRLGREEAGEPPPRPAPWALDRLVDRFGLGPFERDVVLLAAGIELDGRFGALCAGLHGDERRTQATFGLALAALADPDWSALLPHGPLRHHALIELEDGPVLTARPITIPERLVHLLVGLDVPDTLLEETTTPVPARPLPAGLSARVTELAALWARTPRGVIELRGPDSAVLPDVAAAIAARCGLRARRLGKVAPELRRRWAAAWRRDSQLDGLVLLVHGDDADTAALLDGLDVPVIALGRAPALRDRPLLPAAIDGLTAVDSAWCWADAGLPDADGLGSRFLFSPGQLAELAAGKPTPEQAFARCRAVGRPRFGALAEEVPVRARWEDLLLPAAATDGLRALVAWARHRRTVLEASGALVSGATGLFAGPSGTGKTMAAQVIAGALGLDLFRIDLSAVVSKYIGETEKNLRQLFDAAEAGTVVLLFDEADALFGRRVEARDSHDRYANQEVSYLLQRMEAYRGVAVLTTNFRKSLDVAFLRRLRVVIEFPFPDPATREHLWTRALPELPLDLRRLARLNLSGANIRDVGMMARVIAAERGLPVDTDLVLHAARLEMEKLGRPESGAAR